MARRLFTFLSALSLLVCVGTSVLWARSEWFFDSIAIRRGHIVLFSLSSHSGNFLCALYEGDSGNPPLVELRRLNYESIKFHFHVTSLYAASTSKPVLGFGVEREGQIEYVNRQRFRQIRTLLQVPYWFVGLLTALPPFGALRRSWRKRSANGRCCTTCGYDLRATPDRCPECGALARATNRG
ncbi:MAG TPA: hypothetical protein VG269_22790 [Tepidisphaeraceae bacterium]|jgi:hypothetical protein|nr:hypothetical protein [Tepidisphaeraceae bacterium]